LTARAAIGQRLQSRPPIFFIWVSEDKINIAKNLENLCFESLQSNQYRTPATPDRVDSLALFFLIVVIERVDKMKKVIEHPTPLKAGSLASSPYVRHPPDLSRKANALR
jgi:hypothetical protein